MIICKGNERKRFLLILRHHLRICQDEEISKTIPPQYIAVVLTTSLQCLKLSHFE